MTSITPSKWTSRCRRRHPRSASDVFCSIGERVAALVPDAATLQLGIGGVPDAVLDALAGRRDLTVWSEMFSDGVLALDRAGALDPGSPVTASFVFGSAELYDWIDRNPRIRLLRTEKTNDPGLIARHPRMVSVNGALQVDLFAQANAARVHGMIYSGFGGQTDFVVGALHSPGGRAIIALPSWHPKADVSTVVPRLAGPVTSFQHSFIVSEQGTAAIWGHDAAAQAGQIIDQVAHPVGPRRAAGGRPRPRFPAAAVRRGYVARSSWRRCRARGGSLSRMVISLPSARISASACRQCAAKDSSPVGERMVRAHYRTVAGLRP